MTVAQRATIAASGTIVDGGTEYHAFGSAGGLSYSALVTRETRNYDDSHAFGYSQVLGRAMHFAPPRVTADLPALVPGSFNFGVLDRRPIVISNAHGTPASNTLYDSDDLDDIAAGSVFCASLRYLLNPTGAWIVKELRARNPDLFVLGILQPNAFDVGSGGAAPVGDTDPTYLPFYTEFSRKLMLSAARLASGPRAISWKVGGVDGGTPAAYYVNPLHGASWDAATYNPSTAALVVDTVAKYLSQYEALYASRIIDGIWWDYPSDNPFLWPSQSASYVDLRGNAAGSFAADAVAKAAWQSYQRALLDATEEALGAGLVQLVNGNTHYEGSEQPASWIVKSAGTIGEAFPGSPWSSNVRNNILRLLDTHGIAYEQTTAPSSWTPAGIHKATRGRRMFYPWWKTSISGHSDQLAVEVLRMVAFLTGVPYAFREEVGVDVGRYVDDGSYLPPSWWALAQAANGAVQPLNYGETGGNWTFSRQIGSNVFGLSGSVATGFASVVFGV